MRLLDNVDRPAQTDLTTFNIFQNKRKVGRMFKQTILNFSDILSLSLNMFQYVWNGVANSFNIYIKTTRIKLLIDID